MMSPNIAAKAPQVTIDPEKLFGVILAGGQSRRMRGREKSLLSIGGEPLVARVRQRLSHQVADIGVNANGDARRFGFLGLPVIPDRIGGFSGPLAGIHATMIWTVENRPALTHIVTVAADTPFFPRDLVSRLCNAAAKPGEIVLATSNANRHPVFGLWPIELVEDLSAFLEHGESLKVMHFVQRHDNTTAEFEFGELSGYPFDPFFNINTPEELAWAKSVWQQAEDNGST